MKDQKEYFKNAREKLDELELDVNTIDGLIKRFYDSGLPKDTVYEIIKMINDNEYSKRLNQEQNERLKRNSELKDLFIDFDPDLWERRT